MKLKNIYAILGCIALQLNATDPAMIYLSALAQIESGGKDHKIGRAGERSKYQIKRCVWEDYRNTSFTKCKGKEATFVAWNHIHKIWASNHSVKALSPAQFYCAWNMGLNGFRKRGFLVSSCPKRVQERAERFANLVAALKEEQK